MMNKSGNYYIMNQIAPVDKLRQMNYPVGNKPQEEFKMQQLYQVKGLLSKNFTGQITYTFCLPYALEELDICLAFEKQHYASPSQVPVEELADYCRCHYDTTAYNSFSREQLADLFFNGTKTEIHISASLNDQFIGCIHKQLLCRHMHFGPDELSEGCLMPENIDGVLKVTVLAFQVLMDDTPYTVTVSGKKAGERTIQGKMTEKIPDKAAEEVSDKATEKIPDKAAQEVSDKATEKVPEKATEKVPENAMDNVPEEATEEMTGKNARAAADSGKESSMHFLRLELHNHTTESDASLTCQDLLEYMAQDGVDAFALTDHNTISGHTKMKELLGDFPTPIQCIYGMEYTTYYGHILCLNLHEYVPWDSIDPQRPELIFTQIRRTGALAGIAHPFSFGYPFATGCRFEMQVTDYNAVDFIEIFNNPEPLRETNLPALALWENLVLKGQQIAATSGMDLHNRAPFAGRYATFIRDDGMPVPEALTRAVKTGQTWVSKGPLLVTETLPLERKFVFRIVDGHKNGCPVDSRKRYLMTLTLPGGSLAQPISPDVPLSISWEKLEAYAGEAGLCPVIPKLYEDAPDPEALLCVSPVLYLPLTTRQTSSPAAVTASQLPTVAPQPSDSTITPMVNVETAVPR